MTEHSLQTSWNGGEVSPRLHGRTDVGFYDIAVAEMLNFAPTVEGPAIKRSGTIIEDVADPSATTLIPFEFNAQQGYVLEFGQQQVRFYFGGALLRDGSGAPIVLAVPYAASDTPALWWQQSADVLYLVHPAYPPAKISRTGAASFTYATLTFAGGPFADANSNRTVTVTATPTGGALTTVGTTITLTASSPIFAAGHIGGLFQLQALDFSTYTQWEPGYSTSSGQFITWEGNLYQEAYGNSGRTGQTPPTHVIGTEWDGTNSTDINSNTYGVPWTYICGQFGNATITAIGPQTGGLSTTATATIALPMVPNLATKASWRWAFGRFSAANGWPKIVLIWNERLVFKTDFEVMGSVVGDYLNFASFDDTGLLQDDLAFRFRITGSNPIQWAVTDLQVIFGTDRAEYALGPVNSSAKPSSTNMQVTQQSHFGSIPVRPVQAEQKTIFIQRGSRRVRESAYNYLQGRYQSTDMGLYARHLLKPGVKRLGYQQETEEFIWALRRDGMMLAHGFNPDEQVKGWCQMPIADFNGGTATVLDFCVLPSSDGTTDVVHLLVQRGTTRTVEYLAPWWDDGSPITAAQFLDGALTYAGAPVTHFSGLPGNYAGQTIMALADGIVVPNLTVAGDGSFTLPVAASVVTAGIFFPARIVGLPPKFPNKSGGASELQKRRLVKGVLRVIDAAGVWLSALLGTGGAAEVLRRPATTPMDRPTPLANGETDDVKCEGTNDRNGQWVIESRLPLPFMVSQARFSYTVEQGD